MRSVLDPYGSSPIFRVEELVASSDTVLDLPDGPAGLNDMSLQLEASNKTSLSAAVGLLVGEDVDTSLSLTGCVTDLRAPRLRDGGGVIIDVVGLAIVDMLMRRVHLFRSGIT